MFTALCPMPIANTVCFTNSFTYLLTFTSWVKIVSVDSSWATTPPLSRGQQISKFRYAHNRQLR